MLQVKCMIMLCVCTFDYKLSFNKNNSKNILKGYYSHGICIRGFAYSQLICIFSEKLYLCENIH